jgi:radical SAM protein with 4Fe4S-binding SPASM domain
LRRSEYRRLLDEDFARPPRPSDELYHCGGGMTACAIDPYGNMGICVISPHEPYNIRGGSFEEGWNQSLLPVREKKRKRLTKCSQCRIQSLCGMCPANGELDSGDPESPVEFLCEVAHLRAMALGDEVPEHGECEFCNGGDRYGSLLQARENLVTIGQTMRAPLVTLPVLNEASGGCHGRCH